VTVHYLKRPRAAASRREFDEEAGQVDTTNAFDGHELVHAYTIPLWGKAPSLLTEGIAEALGCSWDSQEDPAQDWRPWLNFDPWGSDRDRGYRLSSRFVSHLLVTHGAQRLRQLFMSSWRGENPAEFARTFANLYGQPIEQVWTAAIASGLVCDPVWACAAPAATGEGAFSVGGTCRGSGERLFTVTGDRGLVAHIRGVGVRPLMCAPPFSLGPRATSLVMGGIDNDLIALDVPQTDSWVDLPAGTYALTHYDDASLWTTSLVEASAPPAPWLSPDCSAAQWIDVSGERPTYLALGNSRTRWSVGIRPPDGPIRLTLIGSLLAPRTVDLCHDCGGDCDRVPMGSSFLLDGPRFLVSTPPPLAGYTIFALRPAAP
jgi:hypothetical protein